MAFINIPPVVSELFWGLENRVRRLETAYRFNAPNLNFATNTPTNPRRGDIYYDYNIDVLKYWNGSAWVEIGDSLYGTSIISFTSTWSGTGLTYTGTPALGKYQRIGKCINYEIQITCTNVTNFGTGQYSLTLPTGLAPGYHYQQIGGLHKATDHYIILGDLEPASTTFKLWHPTANGAQDIFSYNKPTTLTTASYFYIAGSYFIA